VIPLRAWRRREGTTRDRAIEARLGELFADSVHGESESDDARSGSSRNGN
jgi:hypothetical protein